MTIHELNISIAEVLEVRGYGLNAPELLSVAVSASDKLPPCPIGTVFDIENVYINSKGDIIIEPIPSNKTTPNYTPPEWAKGEEDPQAAAVYCLGAVLRVAGAEEASDVDLFSLVNIMTVAMIGTRPTAHRMGQMAKNQLRGRDPKSMLMCVYEELMGDEETNQMDIGDLEEFDDEFLYGEDEGHNDENEQYRGQVVISGNNNVKRAVEYFEEGEDNDSQEPRSSRSSTDSSEESGMLSAKSIEEGKNKLNNLIKHGEHTSRDDSISRNTTSSPAAFEDTTLGGIGSPLSQSTRLDETYIEEKSIDMSKSPAKEDDNKKNPFDDDDDEEKEFGGGTLSGRDPFEKETNKDINGSMFKKEPVSHRFSSSSEEIIEATIHDDDEDDDDFNKYKQSNSRDRDDPSPPPIHHYIAQANHDSSLSPLEEAQRALRANKARHKISTASNFTTDSSESQRPRFSKSMDVDESDAMVNGSRKNIPSVSIEKEEEEEINETVEKTQKDPENDKPKSARAGRYRKSDETEDNEDIDEIFEDYKKKSASTMDPSRQTPILTADSYHEPNKQVPSAVVSEARPSPLQRRNSLAPSRISGRRSIRKSVTSCKSMRGKRKTRAIPEFYDLTRHPNVRLRAPASKKKRLSLHRVEETEVIVELLNGQKVEVVCRSDAVSRDIFSLVVQNMNINEHVFFGLSFIRDGEHFFIDDQQRLEKFAPPGWKSGGTLRSASRPSYVLHLRFKYYPQLLDFIKTDVTMNELYLQCRRDVLEERIQPNKDSAFELAAISLQAEFGNRPPPVIADYFDTQHYLPKRFCSFEDPNKLKSILAELHGHYAGTRISEAKHKYIQICQRLSDFGSHIHRVFRKKPTALHGSSPFDPDTGSSIWIGIMPRGISIYEQQGGVREVIAEYYWPNTQTLQFDKKRFVIVAVGKNDEQMETTFFTDHHTKSSYFVRFAASQHRWMMKMRQWKSTLRHENTMQSMPDVIVEGRKLAPTELRKSLRETPPSSPLLESADSVFQKMPEGQKQSVIRPTDGPPPIPIDTKSTLSEHDDEGIVCDQNNETNSTDRNETDGYRGEEQSENPCETQFDVTLRKDPENHGLGLTLVNGVLNGIPAVYVKLVAENSPGMKAGVCVGDRIVSIDNEALDAQGRLRAVELVKRCGDEVKMKIARLDGIIRHDRNASNDLLSVVSAARKKSSTSSVSSNNLNTPKSSSGGSRTPPPPKRAANRRQRAVSDFGAIGDGLPTLDGDNLINIKAISGLQINESDEEKGEYRLPTTSMYAFDRDDELQQSTKKDLKGNEPESRNSSGGELRKYRYARRSNLEPPEELREEDEAEDDNESSDDGDESEKVIDVILERNENGSLGIQIGSRGGKVYIKQLTSEPALSNPDIRVTDSLLFINGVSVTGKTHEQVVSMLRGGGDRVTLGVRRPPPPDYLSEPSVSKSNGASQLISVMLHKKPMGTLGLSLAKRTMSDGIFIRNIAANSAASSEGSLRVGDRLVSLDGESVDGLTPSVILDKLRSIQGPVQITVTRDGTSHD